jgi:hypothetical protein
MPSWRPEGCDRRQFLWTATGLVAAAVGTPRILADEKPLATTPRATSGDAVGPQWEQRLTVTVGPRDADLVGNDNKVIQAAVDYVARLGGGTVRILPGTYRLRNAVYLQSHVRLLGSGTDTVLIKEDSRTSKLAADSDWYDQEITLTDASGFRVGDGVRLWARNPDTKGVTIVKRTLVACSGNRFKLDRPLRENFWQRADASAATLFPLLSGDNIADVVIEDLTLDGNRENNENLDGNYAGCVFLQDCNRVTLRKVTAHQLAGLPRCRCGRLPQPRPHGAGPAPRVRLAADGRSGQPATAQRHRPVLLLGGEVRPGREERDRGQPQLWHLDRPPRHG